MKPVTTTSAERPYDPELLAKVLGTARRWVCTYEPRTTLHEHGRQFLERHGLYEPHTMPGARGRSSPVSLPAELKS